MGYETNYSLYTESSEILQEVKGVDANGNPAAVFIQKFYDVDTFKQEISDLAGYNYLWGEPCKWYDHEKDMRSYSKKYPAVLFKLFGEGEDSFDIWVKYFKNGKMQKCIGIVQYDPFDESKMK